MWKYFPNRSCLQVSTDCLTTQEVEEARHDIVRLVQRQAFYDVLQSLDDSETFPNVSKKVPAWASVH